jgi:hypothetical protein
MRATPTALVAHQARDCALDILRGTPEHNFTKLASLASQLRKVGFDVVIHEVNAAQMDAIVLARAEADHKALMKKTPKAKRYEFDEKKLKLPKANPKLRYFSGWTLSFPTTKLMLQSGTLLRVYACDFAHAKGIFFSSFSPPGQISFSDEPPDRVSFSNSLQTAPPCRKTRLYPLYLYFVRKKRRGQGQLWRPRCKRRVLAPCHLNRLVYGEERVRGRVGRPSRTRKELFRGRRPEHFRERLRRGRRQGRRCVPREELR